MASRTTLRVANPDLSGNPGTCMVEDVAATLYWVTIASADGFPTAVTATPSTYFYIMVGNYGEETTEIVLVTETNDTAFNTEGLRYSHSAGDSITYIPYNQVIFYGLATSGGTPIALETKSIDCSQQTTSYDYSGTTYSIFVTAYYRSAATAETSDISEEITTASFTFNSAKKIIEAGVRKALTRVDSNPEASLSWSVLIDLLNEGLNEIVTRKKKWQVLHKVGGTATTTPGTAWVNKPTGISALEFVLVDGKKIDYITKMRYNQYTNGSAQTGTPAYYTIKNDQIFFYPTPNGVNTVTFDYYGMPDTIVSLSDEVKQEFSMILIYFIAAQAAFIRNNEKRGNLMEIKFQQTLANQIEDVTGYEQFGDAEEVEMTSSYGPYGVEWMD